MPNLNLLQQVPDECFNPVTIGPFTVTLLTIERFSSGYRWIYRIDYNNPLPPPAQNPALSDWVVGIDLPCLDFIDGAFISEVFTGDILPELIPFDEVTSGETIENPGTAPLPCPEDSPCSAGVEVTGFKFDNLGSAELGELGPGESQLFAFVFNQPPLVNEEVCAALKFGNNEACGLICGPACIECPNACDCTENVNTFDLTVPAPGDCFAFISELPEDIRFGFCLGAPTDTGPTPCEGVAEVFVCGQTLVCCCEVNQWARSVDLVIQFNIPKTADCLSENIGEGQFLYECARDTVTVNQTCFTCSDVTESPFVTPLDCTNTTITINSVTLNEDGSVTINYTVNLPECQETEEEPPGQPPSCPPSGSMKRVNNTQSNRHRKLI